MFSENEGVIDFFNWQETETADFVRNLLWEIFSASQLEHGAGIEDRHFTESTEKRRAQSL
jgi:hypothetical protein